MKTLLQLNSSLFSGAGQSSGLAASFVAGWRKIHPDSKVMVRDLARDPVPHLSAERFQAFIARTEDRSAEQRQIVAYSDALIEEIRRADVIVLGLPMYNFGLPSTLKAYFDHIARAGVTFRYTEKGAVGLLAGKQAYVFAARGGSYVGTPIENQTTYVRQFLAFLGIENVQFVYAEGLAVGEASRKASLEQAKGAIAKLLSPGETALAA